MDSADELRRKLKERLVLADGGGQACELCERAMSGKVVEVRPNLSGVAKLLAGLSPKLCRGCAELFKDRLSELLSYFL